ncbi:Rv3654c family TadE-like protein [Microbacterium sp. BWT-B31]|uniref:Rv3654c family TadE-like protein n=1 Tax=Microbacterium sp. BWT-B31 TaxID=3232072 RepID=UPI0035274C6E
MAGSVLAVGVAGAAASVVFVVCVGAAAAVAGQRAAAAADAAALAAADAASGAVSGVPCERAEQMADAASVRLVSCEVDGLIATVAVAGRFGPFAVPAAARAGPEP